MDGGWAREPGATQREAGREEGETCEIKCALGGQGAAGKTDGDDPSEGRAGGEGERTAADFAGATVASVCAASRIESVARVWRRTASQMAPSEHVTKTLIPMAMLVGCAANAKVAAPPVSVQMVSRKRRMPCV